jgi:hypothetical protein
VCQLNCSARRLVQVVSMFFFLSSIATANNSGNFLGFYSVSNAVDLGTQVRVTLAVRIFNYSSADLAGADVTLQDSVTARSDYGAFSKTSIAKDDSVKLSADFTISAREYKRWRNGGTPCLRIDYRDSRGNRLRRRIEMRQQGGEVE